MIQIYNGVGAGFDNLYSQLTLRFCTSAVKKTAHRSVVA